MILFYQPDLSGGATWLPEDESKHCVKVLRKKEGDEITVTDGKGIFYTCSIVKSNPAKCELRVLQQTEEARRNYRIQLAIAPTKNPDRMEWLVEKATEIGIDEITLIQCNHSERSFIKTERLQKVAISAMKQSQKATLPQIHELIPFHQVLSVSSDEKFIAFVDHTNPVHLFNIASTAKKYLTLIGPEGDFSNEELNQALNAGFIKVSLGASRLRTETAGLAACHSLHLVNQPTL